MTRKKKAKKMAGGIGGISIGIPELLLVIAAVAVVAFLVYKLLRP